MAYDQNLSRGLQSTIENTPIEDGKLRFAVDTARLFLDLKNERIEFTDFVRGLTSKEIRSLTNPLPKMYLSSDTHELLFYHCEEWISFGGGGVDDLSQIIHKTYIKGLKFIDNDLVGILGDGSIIKTQGSIFKNIIDKIEKLENDYNTLNSKHEALVKAVTEWGEFNEMPINLQELVEAEKGE